MLLFAHGLEGHPRGRKVSALRRAGFQVTAPDFQGMTLAARMDLLERVSEAMPEPVVLVGSSYGGLAAALVAARFPERFKALVLCAPALHTVEPPNDQPQRLVTPSGVPTAIIHGTRDTVVPIGASREYRDRSGSAVDLHEVDDYHGLADSLELLVQLCRELSRQEH